MTGGESSAVGDLDDGWNVREATLLRSAGSPGEETRFGSTVDPETLGAALDRAARTVRETPPERDGYAVPLHEPGEPTMTAEYVLWRPDSEQVGWFDTGFGISGSVRFVDLPDAAATTLGDRLRCWHPDSTPEAAEPLAEFDLPAATVAPQDPLTGADGEACFAELRAAVDEERERELEANREQHAASSLDALIRRGVATGPFLSLGRVSHQHDVGTFQLQIVADDGNGGGGGRGSTDLVRDEDVYPDSVFLLDSPDGDDALPLTVRTTSVDGATLTVTADVSCECSPATVESLLTDADREFWLVHLLNPVPFDRRTDAVERVAASDEKRDLVTGTRPVRFAADQMSVPSVDLALNEYQQRALKWADDAEDVLCIHGPPGTGKTRTLTAYVLHAVWHGERVLVSAHSNQAVDNLLVGDSTLEDPEAGTLHAFASDEDAAFSVARVGSNSKNEVVREAYGTNAVANADVVAATTSGAAQFDTDEFDVAVVDEATQASRSATAIVLDCARKLVLSGDHKQLPPYSGGDPGDGDPRPSLFEHLLERYGEDISVLLGRQYRMHDAIAAFPNEAFYGGRLETAARNADWRIDGLDPLVGLDVDGEERRTGGNSFANPREAAVVVDEVRTLVEHGVAPADVGVISMYSGQVGAIRSRLANADIDGAGQVTVDTVDSFQGGEREAVVVSFVRSNDAGNSGFLEFPAEGPRRLNVALTRARKRLVLVGDWDTLAAQSPGRDPGESCADVYAELRRELEEQGRLRQP